MCSISSLLAPSSSGKNETSTSLLRANQASSSERSVLYDAERLLTLGAYDEQGQAQPIEPIGIRDTAGNVLSFEEVICDFERGEEELARKVGLVRVEVTEEVEKEEQAQGVVFAKDHPDLTKTALRLADNEAIRRAVRPCCS